MTHPATYRRTGMAAREQDGGGANLRWAPPERRFPAGAALGYPYGYGWGV